MQILQFILRKESHNSFLPFPNYEFVESNVCIKKVITYLFEFFVLKLYFVKIFVAQIFKTFFRIKKVFFLKFSL